MSVAVCGVKRSFFEDFPSSPQISKRLRCSSSPIRLSLPTLIDHLRSLFPHLEYQIIERVLQECGNDLDAAIKSLNRLCLGHVEEVSVTTPQPETTVETGAFVDNGDATVSGNQQAENNLHVDGPEWIDLFVREMTCASSVDDAKARAGKMLEVLEKSINARVSSEAIRNLQKENLMLKYQVEDLTKERNCFKSAFKIQRGRLSDYEDKDRELQQLKKLMTQYQEQIRTLEVKNYALQMHLNQAQKHNSFTSHFARDAF